MLNVRQKTSSAIQNSLS